jgi:hypothetical protein
MAVTVTQQSRSNLPCLPLKFEAAGRGLTFALCHFSKKVYFSEWPDPGKKTIHKSPKYIFMYM